MSNIDYIKKIITKDSLKTLREISLSISTFHHMSHVILDLANSYPQEKKVKYLEIGTYAGASSALMMQRKNTQVVGIGIGSPISPSQAVAGVEKFWVHKKNEFTYIHGRSEEEDIKEKVFDKLKDVDILFIDGDHEYNAVINDYKNYSHLVNKGGYILFDDYSDKEHSPQVREAVDYIVSNLLNDEYDVYGLIPNIFGARPESMVEGNCFLLRKKL